MDNVPWARIIISTVAAQVQETKVVMLGEVLSNNRDPSRELARRKGSERASTHARSMNNNIDKKMRIREGGKETHLKQGS